MQIYGAIVPWSSHWTYIMFGALIVAVIFGTWAGAVAARKGRSMQIWFLIGFFIPVIGLIAAYVVGTKETAGKSKPNSKK